MNHLYTAEATAHGAAGIRVTTQDLDLPLNRPEELGGEGGEGTNPERLIAAGYASCFQAALGVLSTRKETSLPADLEITARVELFENGDAYDFKIALIGHFPGMERAEAQALMEEALNVCPMTRATNAELTLEVR